MRPGTWRHASRALASSPWVRRLLTPRRDGSGERLTTRRTGHYWARPICRPLRHPRGTIGCWIFTRRQAEEQGGSGGGVVGGRNKSGAFGNVIGGKGARLASIGQPGADGVGGGWPTSQPGHGLLPGWTPDGPARLAPPPVVLSPRQRTRPSLPHSCFAPALGASCCLRVQEERRRTMEAGDSSQSKAESDKRGNTPQYDSSGNRWF